METARHDSIDFFLGATTPAGFKGLSLIHISEPTRP